MKYRYSSYEDYNIDLPINEIIHSIKHTYQQYKYFPQSKEFFENWITVFEKLYLFYKNRQIILDGKFFKEDIFFKKSGKSFRWHFNIDNASRLLNLLDVQQIKLSYFTTDFNIKETYCKYTHIVENNTKDYISTTFPIILVHYYLSNMKYLVIDGNHRISAKKLHNQKTINAVIINPFDTANLMPTKFEQAFYLFLCEINNLNDCLTASCASMFLS